MSRYGAVAGVLLTCALLAACGDDADAGEKSAWAAESQERAASNSELVEAIEAPKERMDDAYAFCVEKISDQLKAPATAEFSLRNPASEAIDGDHYLFSGTVDSQNSFGALLRSDFACDVRWTSGGFVADQAVVG